MTETVERRIESVFLGPLQYELPMRANYWYSRQSLRWNTRELL